MSGFSGQGKVLIGKRLNSGLPDVMRWIGNASVFKIGQAQDTIERRESYTGNRLPARRLTKANSGTLDVVFDEFSVQNLVLATLGVNSVVAAGSAVTNYVLPTGATVGDSLLLPAKNVSAVTIKDSTGSPKTLTLNTNYTLDAFAASITLLDLTTGGTYVQPFKADYTPGAVNVVGAFQALAADMYVRLDGINTDDGTRCICDVFRARFSPSKDLPLIGDDYVDFELSGTVLADTLRQTSAVGGQFYSLTTP